MTTQEFLHATSADRRKKGNAFFRFELLCIVSAHDRHISRFAVAKRVCCHRQKINLNFGNKKQACRKSRECVVTLRQAQGVMPAGITRVGIF